MISASSNSNLCSRKIRTSTTTGLSCIALASGIAVCRSSVRSAVQEFVTTITFLLNLVNTHVMIITHHTWSTYLAEFNTSEDETVSIAEVDTVSDGHVDGVRESITA